MSKKTGVEKDIDLYKRLIVSKNTCIVDGIEYKRIEDASLSFNKDVQLIRWQNKGLENKINVCLVKNKLKYIVFLQGINLHRVEKPARIYFDHDENICKEQYFSQGTRQW